MSPAPIASKLAAFLGPFLVLGTFLGWLLRPEPWTPTEIVAGQNERIQGRKPQILVLGSSWARTDVLPELLADTLGFERSAVLPLYQHASQPPIWYAMLKYRLYTTPARPRLVVLVTGVPPLLEQQPLHLEDLEQHFAEPDEVLLRKVWNQPGSLLWGQVSGRRGALRDGLLSGVRAGVIDLFFDPDPGVSLSEMQADASHRVFARVEASGMRTLPVVEEVEKPTEPTLGSVSGSFLWDIADLVDANGGRLVVVVPPVASYLSGRQALSSTDEAAFIEEANQRHIGWVDLRSLPLEDRAFMNDGGHMRPEGARIFTAEMVESLQKLGAFEEGPLRKAVPPAIVRSVERAGTVPVLTVVPSPVKKCLWAVDLQSWNFLTQVELARMVGEVPTPVRAIFGQEQLVPEVISQVAEEDCGVAFDFRGKRSLLKMAPKEVPTQITLSPELSAEGPLWVYPGTELRWSLSGVVAGKASLEMVARVLGSAEGAPRFSWDNQPLPVNPSDEGVEAVAELLAEGGDHVLSIASPPDGPFLLVRRISVEVGEQRTDVVIRPTGTPLDLLAGEFQTTNVAPLLTKEADQATNFWEIPVPWKNNTGCSPLMVLEDGEPMDTPKGERTPLKAGQARHRGTSMEFLPSDEAPHHYDLQLDPGRFCASARGRTDRWIYPGDQLTTQVSLGWSREPLGAIRRLHLVGDFLDSPSSPYSFHLIVRYQATVVYEGDVNVAELPSGLDLTLDRFIPRGKNEILEVELKLSEGATPLKLAMTAIPM